jgi:hypothetical protein
MSDFRVRLSQEYEELALKVEKLRNFLFSDAFNELSCIDKELLKAQLSYMEGYLLILCKRHDRFC